MKYIPNQDKVLSTCSGCYEKGEAELICRHEFERMNMAIMELSFENGELKKKLEK